MTKPIGQILISAGRAVRGKRKRDDIRVAAGHKPRNRHERRIAAKITKKATP